MPFLVARSIPSPTVPSSQWRTTGPSKCPASSRKASRFRWRWATMSSSISEKDVTAYHSFAGEVEASNTPTIRRLTLSRRHQLSPIAHCGAANHSFGNRLVGCVSLGRGGTKPGVLSCSKGHSVLRRYYFGVELIFRNSASVPIQSGTQFYAGHNSVAKRRHIVPMAHSRGEKVEVSSFQALDCRFRP